MKGKNTILLYDTDPETLTQIKALLPQEEFFVETVADGTQILPRVRSTRPAVLIANPDAHAFNDYDICKYVKQEMNIPVILLIDKTSATRAQFADCEADDVFQKPLDENGVLNIIRKQIAMSEG